MCFRNLPIDVDSDGNAKLRAGAVDPFSVRAPLRTPMTGAPRHGRAPFESADAMAHLVSDHVTWVEGDNAVELQPLLELVDQGCPPDLAVRIAAPLDWEPGTA